MEEKKPIGILFESIPYYDPEDFSNLINSLSKPQSLFMITKALEYSYKMGVFSLAESEVVSKCLRQLNTQQMEYDSPESK
jgi:hypothetical protein